DPAGRFSGETAELGTGDRQYTGPWPRRRRRPLHLALRGAECWLRAPAADLPAPLGDGCRAGRPVRLPYRSAISGKVTWSLTFRYNAAPVFPPAQTPPRATTQTASSPSPSPSTRIPSSTKTWRGCVPP